MTTGRMNNRMKSTLQNEDGMMTIWYVIIGLMLALMISGMLTSFMKFRAINEMQGTLDVAGVAALRFAVDENAFRDGELKVNESVVITKFRSLIELSELERAIKANSLHITARVINVKQGQDLSHVPGGSGLLSSKDRAQVYLVSEAYMTFTTLSELDKIIMTRLNYYDFFQSRASEISINGTNADGEYEVVVRSVSRLVLR